MLRHDANEASGLAAAPAPDLGRRPETTTAQYHKCSSRRERRLHEPPRASNCDPMDHSLLAASRTTHVKIVVVALLGAILVVSVGIAAHVSATPSAAVLKAGQSVTYTGHNGTLAR